MKQEVKHYQPTADWFTVCHEDESKSIKLR